ncbi:MAG: hypothetical protein NTW52_04305 [Planctomycetota bacterium]|nr:hypothetical protein [Planctomycetota bacterium]
MLNYSDEELVAYLEESLPLDKAADLEKLLRNPEDVESKALLDRLQQLIFSRDSGTHTIGEIWKRHRLSCPTREDLGRYILEAMSDDEAAYIKIHIEEIECEVCRSNLDDLRRSASPSDQASIKDRRSRYFQSSVGRLKKQ